MGVGVAVGVGIGVGVEIGVLVGWGVVSAGGVGVGVGVAVGVGIGVGIGTGMNVAVGAFVFGSVKKGAKITVFETVSAIINSSVVPHQLLVAFIDRMLCMFPLLAWKLLLMSAMFIIILFGSPSS